METTPTGNEANSAAWAGALLADMADGGLKRSVTVWGETAALGQTRDEAIAAVRDALAHDRIPGPSPVTTIRLLDRNG